MASPCALCGETNPARFRIWFDSSVKLFRCLSCGFVMQVDAVGRGTIIRDYPDRYDLSLVKAGATFRHPKREMVFQEIAARAARLNTGRELLDVGCGDGHFLYRAAKLGFKCCGVEPSKAFSAYAASVSGADVVASHYRADLFPPERFDIITFIQVLEHIETPLDALRAAHRHLKPAGHILVEVPSISAPHFLLYRATGFPGFASGPHGAGVQHVGYYTPRTLSRMMATAGFEQVRMVTGRWQYRYRALRTLGRLIDPVLDLLRIGGILYIGRKAA